MYSYIWFACHASGRECVESLEEVKERFAFDKKDFKCGQTHGIQHNMKLEITL